MRPTNSSRRLLQRHAATGNRSAARPDARGRTLGRARRKSPPCRAGRRRAPAFAPRPWGTGIFLPAVRNALEMASRVALRLSSLPTPARWCGRRVTPLGRGAHAAERGAARAARCARHAHRGARNRERVLAARRPSRSLRRRRRRCDGRPAEAARKRSETELECIRLDRTTSQGAPKAPRAHTRANERAHASVECARDAASALGNACVVYTAVDER